MKIEMGHLLATVCALLATSGCVAQRGGDFGRWLGSSELTPLIRIASDSTVKPPTGSDRVLLLPPLGDLPTDYAVALHRSFYRETRNYFPVSVSCLPLDAPPARYVTESNLVPDGTQLNIQEAARAGAALGASHVLCVHVRDFRPYPPQVLALRLVLIDVVTARIVGEVDGSFDAAQQQVVLALANHLQSRRAREYGNHSLTVMLQSPTEYSAFVSASCCRSLALALWGKEAPKETRHTVDDNNPSGNS